MPVTEHRLLAFRRWDGTAELLVVGSLNNAPFANGYTICGPGIPAGQWREIFNSDAVRYGGSGLLNQDTLSSGNGAFTARVPANSVLVFAAAGIVPGADRYSGADMNINFCCRRSAGKFLPFFIVVLVIFSTLPLLAQEPQ